MDGWENLWFGASITRLFIDDIIGLMDEMLHIGKKIKAIFYLIKIVLNFVILILTPKVTQDLNFQIVPSIAWTMVIILIIITLCGGIKSIRDTWKS